VNLPPGIVRKAAEQISQLNNISLDVKDLKVLEYRLQEQNRITEKMMKEQALKRTEEEQERLVQMVADN